ncbi:MAG: HAD-IIIA family hydrolase [Candidatus Omnitrophica bacterium]|nr:HAD-IIIA family hydrolase [Candidatus Omnitrophota bacterium]
MKRYIFLDRDGTICVEKEYLDDFRKMEFIEGAEEALRIMKKKGYKVIIVTNQSGVARGKFSIEEAENQKKYFLNYFLGRNIYLDGYFYCPHHPEGIIKDYAIYCLCRKPNPGLIYMAIDNKNEDLSFSYVVGDKKIDIELALNVGAIPVLVRTGYGIDEEKKINKKDKVQIFNNIYDFALTLKEV